MTELKNDLNKIAPALALGDKMLEGGETANTSCLALVPQIETFRGTIILKTYHENGSQEEDPLYAILDVEDGAVQISDCDYSIETLVDKLPGRGYSKSAIIDTEALKACEGDINDSAIVIARAGTLQDAIMEMNKSLDRNCPDSWRQNEGEIKVCKNKDIPVLIAQPVIDTIMRYADHDARSSSALMIAQRMKMKEAPFKSFLCNSVMN